MKSQKIRIPIYFGCLILLRDNDWQYINKRYKLTLDNSFNAVVFKQDGFDGSVDYVIAFKGDPQLSVIAHEAVHVVNHIYNDRMISLDPVNDEPQAYLTGWIVDKVCKFLKV